MAPTDLLPIAVPPTLQESTGFLLSKAGQRAALVAEAALMPAGIKPRHFGVLVLVAESGPHTQQQIGDRLEIDRTTMAAVADDLERLGLAERKPHPGNRRANAIHLTAHGRAVLPGLRAAVAAAEEDLLRPLSAAERPEFYRLLAKLSPSGTG